MMFSSYYLVFGMITAHCHILITVGFAPSLPFIFAAKNGSLLNTQKIFICIYFPILATWVR